MVCVSVAMDFEGGRKLAAGLTWSSADQTRCRTSTDTEGMLPHNKSEVRRQSEASTALWMSLRDSD
jgi:hypothetical protein